MIALAIATISASELAFGHAELRRPNLLCGTQSEKRHPCAARLDDDHPLAPA